MPGIDAYTKLLLHCDGADETTSFIDSARGKTMTAVGNAQIDTAQKVFGSASGLLDGTTDGLTTPDHADFDFVAGNFTIDFRVRFNARTALMILTDKVATATAFGPFKIAIDATNFYFLSSANNSTWGVAIQWAYTTAIVNDTWYHIACVRYGNVWNLHLDGVIKATTTVSQTVHVNTTIVSVGSNADASGSLNGWIDELRISKGIARWTANFTPPTSPYSFGVPGGVGIGSPLMI